MVRLLILSAIYGLCVLIAVSFSFYDQNIILIFKEYKIEANALAILILIVTLILLSTFIIKFFVKALKAPSQIFSSIKIIRKNRIKSLTREAFTSIILNDSKKAHEDLNALKSLDKNNEFVEFLDGIVLAHDHENLPDFFNKFRESAIIKFVEIAKDAYENQKVTKLEEVHNLLKKNYKGYQIIKEIEKWLTIVKAKELVALANFDQAEKVILNSDFYNEIELIPLLIDIHLHKKQYKKLEHLINKSFDIKATKEAFDAYLILIDDLPLEKKVKNLYDFFKETKSFDDARLLIVNYCLNQNLLKDAKEIFDEISNKDSLRYMLIEIRLNMDLNNIHLANKHISHTFLKFYEI
ncbi:MAG: hypothetical protein J0H68_00490 [Sphingobacteriia bacterium]|nr:hypothetical protein [Sphingobacteriia bacterium]